MSSTPQIDAAAVQALVAEVVRRIRGGQPAAAATPAPAEVAPAAAAGRGAAFPLTDRVITLGILERVPAGVRELVVEPKAVITPSAVDRARELGLVIIRGPQARATALSRPFIVAQAACRGDAAARAASIARGVAGAQQLPASGLADVITALAGHASRDAARGVLLTGRPAVAVVLANRSASLRAVTGRDAASLLTAAADAAANLLIIDPATFTGTSLERICGDFHRGPSAAVPSELAAAAPGCGCQTHTH